jgi:MFS family permease
LGYFKHGASSRTKRKRALFLSLLWFLWFNNIYARAVFSPILPLLEDEFVVSHAQASSIFMFQSIGYGIALFFAGLYCGTFGYKKSIALSLVVASATFSLIPFVKSFSTFYVLSLVIGLSSGAYIPSVIPLITLFLWMEMDIRNICYNLSLSCSGLLADRG